MCETPVFGAKTVNTVLRFEKRAALPTTGRYHKLLIRQDLDSSGAEGSRTLDLCIANAALSQLSYGP